ncbi:Phenylalanine--tRNA ligase beta subunit [Thelohanellus kitauei]|uniref:Phenylalanine--tRNA ligase beta subunit n=1 Tax=Thelohanellus kitauei TaxID=669202 RepID=A0A0C2IG24_THEKT|nr:Phenylalanine--tRNA ligase beta subunit [Thelohanellus kitauei]
MLRLELMSMGYIETLSFILGSTCDMIGRLNLEQTDQALPVKIDSVYENNCVRNSLIPVMLKTVASNQKSPLPIKTFEVSDVVIRSDSPTGVKNQRNLAAIYCGTSSGFELIHGVLDTAMASLEIKPYFQFPSNSSYRLEESNHPMYLPLRCCAIKINNIILGYMGIIHPNVLKNFEIHQSVCSCIEINVELMLSFHNSPRFN